MFFELFWLIWGNRQINISGRGVGRLKDQLDDRNRLRSLMLINPPWLLLIFCLQSYFYSLRLQFEFFFLQLKFFLLFYASRNVRKIQGFNIFLNIPILSFNSLEWNLTLNEWKFCHFFQEPAILQLPIIYSRFKCKILSIVDKFNTINSLNPFE